MKPISILLVALTLLGSQALAIEVQGNALVLSDEEKAACSAQGGCALITQKAFIEAMQNALEQGGKRSCNNQT